MPPKQRFNHDLILKKAYNMFTEGGMEAVNARSVSKALQCSTQPIFSYFPDMGGLRAALIEKGYEDFTAIMKKAEEEGGSILARCLAYEQFAAEQPNVFLFLIGNHPLNKDEKPGKILFTLPEEILRAEAERLQAGEDAVQWLQHELCVYAHGAATLLALRNTGADAEALAKATGELYTVLADQLGK